VQWGGMDSKKRWRLCFGRAIALAPTCPTGDCSKANQQLILTLMRLMIRSRERLSRLEASLRRPPQRRCAAGADRGNAEGGAAVQRQTDFAVAEFRGAGGFCDCGRAAPYP